MPNNRSKTRTQRTFEDINPNPEIADTLRQLYDHPDFVELYPGLVAEDDKKPMVPGVGIGPTYTISRAILSDAVTLVRSDRFYTVDYTAGALTNWGYEEASSNAHTVQGCVGYKLFLRAFPNHFKFNSIYAMFPLTIPSENKKIHEAMGSANQFSFDPPMYSKQRIPVRSYNAVKAVLTDSDTYKITWGVGFDYVMEAPFMLSGDGPPYAAMKKYVGDRLYLKNIDWKTILDLDFVGFFLEERDSEGAVELTDLCLPVDVFEVQPVADVFLHGGVGRAVAR